MRKSRKHPHPVADAMAARALRPDGRASTVRNPTARKVLAWGFTELFGNRCRPVVRRLTEAEAASLPGYCPTPPGAEWFAAFGLDVDGRGTWSTCWALVRGLPPEEARDQIEIRLLADLARACNLPGLPVMGAR